jgi:hypothetical protein
VTLLMIESGLPGCRAAAMTRLSRSTAAWSAAEISVIVRDTSVAVSMARSAMLGWGVGWGVSIFTIALKTSTEARRGRRLWLSARALVFEQRVRRPLAIRDRRRFERRAAASRELMHWQEFCSARETAH